MAREREFGQLSDELVFWFGDNRRDILMLAALLHFLDKDLPIQMVACGVTRGIGACMPDDCAAAYGSHQRLTREIREDLLELWEEYTSSDPALLCMASSKWRIAGRNLASDGYRTRSSGRDAVGDRHG